MIFRDFQKEVPLFAREGKVFINDKLIADTPIIIRALHQTVNGDIIITGINGEVIAIRRGVTYSHRITLSAGSTTQVRSNDTHIYVVANGKLVTFTHEFNRLSEQRIEHAMDAEVIINRATKLVNKGGDLHYGDLKFYKHFVFKYLKIYYFNQKLYLTDSTHGDVQPMIREYDPFNLRLSISMDELSPNSTYGHIIPPDTQYSSEVLHFISKYKIVMPTYPDFYSVTPTNVVCEDPIFNF